MAVQRAFFHWLVPGAFLLPLWLLIGWAVTGAGAWALVWVIVIAVPSVFLGQLLLALLVRARGTVRAARAVSWQDIATIGTWNVLTIGVGLFPQGWFWLLLIAAIVMFFVSLGGSLVQLWREAQPRRVVVQHTASGQAYIPPTAPRASTKSSDPDVVIIEEKPAP